MSFKLKQWLVRIITILVVGYLLLHYLGYFGWLVIQAIFWLFVVCFVIVKLLPFLVKYMTLLAGQAPPPDDPPNAPPPPPAPQAPAFCPKCGAPWAPGVRVCPNCG